MQSRKHNPELTGKARDLRKTMTREERHLGGDFLRYYPVKFIRQKVIDNYIAILREELVLATGCTEPIAIAYCAAKVQKLLDCPPERITAVLSGNILKNVKSVVVPNTGGRKGIRPAIAAGMVAGDESKDLQVIAEISEEDFPKIDTFLETVPIHISCSDSPCKLDIDITAYAQEHMARVRITNHHTNVVHLEKDGNVMLSQPIVDQAEEQLTDKTCLNVEDIVRFADIVPIEDVEPLLERQVRLNSAISEEGLRGTWGAKIGRILLEDYGDDIKQKAKAYAAAASDQVTDIIDPKESRARIALTLRTLLSKRESHPAKKHGNMPL